MTGSTDTGRTLASSPTGPGSTGRRAARLGVAAGLCALGALALGGCAGHSARPQATLAASKVTTIGVNSYLWRASLDALSFMPLLQTDSNGGVIVTDWYVDPKDPSERMKVSVTILDQDLRADAINVAATRETLKNGTWMPAPVQAATVEKLEDIILTKARDLRRESMATAEN